MKYARPVANIIWSRNRIAITIYAATMTGLFSGAAFSEALPINRELLQWVMVATVFPMLGAAAFGVMRAAENLIEAYRHRPDWAVIKWKVATASASAMALIILARFLTSDIEPSGAMSEALVTAIGTITSIIAIPIFFFPLPVVARCMLKKADTSSCATRN